MPTILREALLFYGPLPLLLKGRGRVPYSIYFSSPGNVLYQHSPTILREGVDFFIY